MLLPSRPLGNTPEPAHHRPMSSPTRIYMLGGVALDAITVTGVRARGHHGVHDHERTDGQEFVADLVIHLDTRAAARTDQLDATVSYAEAAEVMVEEIAGPPADLIETVAERIARRVLGFPRVKAVDVTIHKPDAPVGVPFDDVSVTIRRDHLHGDAWDRLRVASAGINMGSYSPQEGEDPLDARPSTPADAVIALGSNMGDSADILASAIGHLERVPGIDVVAHSPLARTAPVGGPEQPDFLNAVIRVRTSLSPRGLLQACMGVEMIHGRQREGVNAPRTLDLDLIDYAGIRAESDDLVLPHPRAAERAFVLAPWAAMEPEATFPGGVAGENIVVAEAAAAAADAAGIEFVADPWDRAIAHNANVSVMTPPAPHA